MKMQNNKSIMDYNNSMFTALFGANNSPEVEEQKREELKAISNRPFFFSATSDFELAVAETR